MTKRIFGIAVLFLIAIAFAFCDADNVEKKLKYNIKNNSPIDTFKLKYNVEINGRKKSIDENIYVGMEVPIFKINNNEYKSFVFGDSVNSVIALVRQDSDSLSYINARSIDNSSGVVQQNFEAGALLYFNKKVNYKWKVDIDSSYFWKREITFAGIEHIDGEYIYVYNVDADDSHSDIGNHISKIYYSKEQGFVKFEIKTHWFPVEVNKLK
jgi:hypothetical protein